jgi:hypothetical protein
MPLVAMLDRIGRTEPAQRLAQRGAQDGLRIPTAFAAGQLPAGRR